MPPVLFLSTLPGKEVNAIALETYLRASVLTPKPDGGFKCITKQLQCGCGDGIDVYLNIHDAMRRTFLDHSCHLYQTALQLCPYLSINVIPCTASAAPSASSTPIAMPHDPPPASSSAVLQVVDDAAALLQQWRRYDAAMIADANGFQPSYTYVAVGGTFDHLHSGHKLLLGTAAVYARGRLRVGVTGPALLTKKKYAEQLQTIAVRRDHVTRFLKRLRPDLELEVEEIVDVSGGTDRIAAVEALVVSPETRRAVELINDLREKNGIFVPLKEIVIPYAFAKDGEVVSSTSLRAAARSGEM